MNESTEKKTQKNKKEFNFALVSDVIKYRPLVTVTDDSQRLRLRSSHLTTTTNENSRRIKWPTDLHSSFGLDINDSIVNQQQQQQQKPIRLGQRFKFPSIDKTAAIIKNPTIHHLDNNTNNFETISNSNINSNQSNIDDNIKIANIVTNVFDIVETGGGYIEPSFQSMTPNITNTTIVNNFTEIVSNHAVPFIYIDDNGIFQIKFNQSVHILPPITRNISSIQFNGNKMTSINDKNKKLTNNNNLDELEQYDIDVRFSSSSDDNVIIEQNSTKNTNENDKNKQFVIIVDEIMKMGIKINN